MICGWQELLHILPQWLAQEVDMRGNNRLRELRLRLGEHPQLRLDGKELLLSRRIKTEDLSFCVNTATKYSPWAATTVSEGFITATGGHRIGICGEAIGQGESMKGLKNIRSLCIRVAGDFPGIAAPLTELKGSVLIIGSPGSGKTTLLRDYIRQLSARENISVIDQRGELFPVCFKAGPRTDILTGCEKDKAIDILLRTMAPDTIAMDEITKERDCVAMEKAAWCGVRLIATAHAANEDELHRRAVYAPILKAGIFDHLVVLDRNKSWRAQRL